MEDTVTISLCKYEEMKSDLKLLNEIKDGSEFILETRVEYGRTYTTVRTNSVEAKDLVERISNLKEDNNKTISEKLIEIKDLKLEIDRLKDIILKEKMKPWWCFWKS